MPLLRNDGNVSHDLYQFQERKGILTLIDCAGSERRHDSMYHDSQRQKESAEINASLWAIKVRETSCL
jgi:kinesin family protein 2/24